jgi:hypothetical protein
MEARSQLRHRPTCTATPRHKVGSNLFIVPQLLRIVKPYAPTDFENMWKISILNKTLPTPQMNLNLIRTPILVSLFLSTPCLRAQITLSGPPVPYTSVSQLNAILAPLQQASETTQTDLAKLRIDKWKADSGYKKQILSNVDSIKRNLQSALPEIIGQLQNSPEDLSATFKLYRNLDALYDVLGSVAESAGAFGSKDEFQSLSNDLNAMERNRRSLAERLEGLTVSKEAELSQLRTQVKTLQAATPPPPPKKIVVDDNEPKKPAPKKKPVPKPPKPPVAPAQPTQPQQ